MSCELPTLERFVDQANELYSLPAIAMQVMELTSDVKANSKRLKECIEQDPALCSRILRVVNSSLYGLSQPVCGLNQAVALLGLKPLKLLVLGFSLPEELIQETGGEVLARFWRQTLIRSVAARAISERLNTRLDDEAFIAGLLQEIGQLVLARCLGPSYLRFLGRIQTTSADTSQLQRRMLGFTHAQLSAELLRLWRLPNLIVEAVGSAQALSNSHSSRNPLAEILYYAEQVVGLLSDDRSPALDHWGNLTRDVRLSRSWLGELLTTLEEKVDQLAGILSLELPDDTSYRDLLNRARTQMSLLATEVVSDLIIERNGVAPDSEPEESLIQEAALLSQELDTVCRNRNSLKAAQQLTSAATHSAQAVAEPRDSTSPTVENESLLEHLRTEVIQSRLRRSPLSLLLVEIDRFKDVLVRHGADQARTLLAQLEQRCRTIDHHDLTCIPTADKCLAIVLPDCDRYQVARLGNRLIREAQGICTSVSGASDDTISINIGASTVNVPPPNFRAENLAQSAARCLCGARHSGGNVVKTIEIN